MTAGAGKIIFGFWTLSRVGEDTGGGTIIVVAAEGPRKGGGWRRTSEGAGWMIGLFIATTERDWSRGTSFAAGSMTTGVRPIV